MLEIASIVGVVVAVLFGICLTIFIKSYRDYSSDDTEEENETPPRRRRSQTEGTPSPKPRREEREERKERPSDRTGTSPKPAVKAETKAETKTGEKAEAKAEAKAEPKTETKPEAKPETKAETKSEARAEARADVRSAPRPVKDTPAQPAGTPAADVKPKTETKAEVKPEAKPETKTEAKTGTKAEPTDFSATRVVSREETLKLREASRKALAEKDIYPVDEDDDEDDDDRSRKLVPIIVAVAAVAAVLCVAALVFAFTRGGRERNVELPDTVSVTVQDIQLQTTLTGRITNPDIMTSMFAATGKVDLKVKEGDYVTKGSTIYSIDSENLQARIDLLNERLNSLSAERTETSSTSVTSPAAGTVTDLLVADGSTVDSGDPIAEISSPASNQVTVILTTRVSTGQSVSVLTNGNTYNGTVTAVSTVGPAPSEPEDENGEASGEDGQASEDEDAARSDGSGSGTGAATSPGGVTIKPQDSGENNTAPSYEPLYQATVSFSGSDVGDTAYVTVNGDRSSGNVVRGRASVTTVAARSGGQVDFNVSEGDSVSAGDTIARITTQRNVTDSGNSFDRREVELEIEQLETEMQNYTVKASVDGYIQKLYLKNGENAAVGMNAVTIVPAVGLIMTVDIDAETAQELTVPRAAVYRLNRTGGFDDEVWDKLDTDTDTITVMENLVPSETDPDMYTGYITLDRPELYRDGMTADVSIVTYSAHSAMTLPQELVRDGKVRILREGGQVTEVPVDTGVVTEDGFVEIKEGLLPSDRIVKE